MNKHLGRIAGIDYGEKRIGVAISDTSQIIASPLKAIIANKNLQKTAELIAAEFISFAPLNKIVLGLPLHMNGKDSPMSLKVRELALLLEKLFNIPVVLWDERLTTAQVERTLKEAEMSRKKQVRYLDAMAAAAILQSYLDCQHLNNK